MAPRIGKTNYASTSVPRGYVCGTCGATGCKLWREYNTFMSHQTLECPAAVRFLSVEPMLGPVDLTRWLATEKIHQVIVGAESGRGARPFEEGWARAIRDQCQAAGVAFCFKQCLDERGRKVSLPLLDGRSWAESPGAAGVGARGGAQ